MKKIMSKKIKKPLTNNEVINIEYFLEKHLFYEKWLRKINDGYWLMERDSLKKIVNQWLIEFDIKTFDKLPQFDNLESTQIRAKEFLILHYLESKIAYVMSEIAHAKRMSLKNNSLIYNE